MIKARYIKIPIVILIITPVMCMLLLILPVLNALSVPIASALAKKLKTKTIFGIWKDHLVEKTSEEICEWAEDDW